MADDDETSSLLQKNKSEIRRIYKNVIALGVAFMFLFSGVFGILNVESSLNQQGGLGLASIGVLGGSLMVSCFILGPVITRFAGARKTMIMGMFCFLFYMAANFYSSWETLIPTAFLYGMGSAPMWASQSVYVSEMSKRFVVLAGVDLKTALNRFYGIFFAFMETSSIWGNLLVSTVLTGHKSNETQKVPVCGANSCPDLSGNYSGTTFERPPDYQVYLVSGGCLAFGIIAPLIVLLCVDYLPKTADYGDKPNVGAALASTTKQLLRPMQLLLIPVTIHSGVQNSYSGTIFARAFITCEIGIDKVGYAMIIGGIVNSGSTAIIGPLMSKVGFTAIFTLATIINGGLLVLTLLPFETYGTAAILSFVAVWNVQDAIWQAQLYAFYGHVFKEEQDAAFALLKMWKSSGLLFNSFAGIYLCTSLITYIHLSLLSIAFVTIVFVDLYATYQSNSPQELLSIN